MRHLRVIGVLVTFLFITIPSHAALIEAPAHGAVTGEARDIDLMREELRARLIEMGLTPVQSRQRVERLTATEVAQLHAQLDSLPAGQGRISTTNLLLIIIILILLL